MSRLARSLPLLAALLGASAPHIAHAQDAGTTSLLVLGGDAGGATSDANLAAAATVGQTGDGGVVTAPEPTGNCQADPVPSGHAVRVETRIGPEAPMVGERVIITYRLHHRRGDSVEFDPDPAAFAQPAIEMEYAREQPERDRTAHRGDDGNVYGEVRVAVQPFRIGEVVIAPQLARLNAAGDIVRVCTPVVRFRVRDPFGNDPHPVPRDLTAPENVTEDAYRWRYGALILDALFLVVLATLLVSAYVRSRPKPVIPPPPPRPPWEIALQALDVIGKSDLLSRGHTKDYYDAISDVVRKYVGTYRGFDALEMTTDEVLARVRRMPLPGVAPAEIEHLLGECDLVKFARYVPSHEQSENILAQAYHVVRRSTPGGGGLIKPKAAASTPSEPGSGPSTPPGNDGNTPGGEGGSGGAPPPATPTDSRRA